MLNWLFAALIVVLLLTMAAHVLNGGVVFVSPMPVVRQATKAHIAVLLAVLAIIKAADYWLDRYDVTNSERGIVQGATYSVVKAQLPAILLLILIALLTAGLYLSVIRTGSFRLPLIASALWLVVAIVGGHDLPGARAVARRQPEPGVSARRRTSNATSWPPARRSGSPTSRSLGRLRPLTTADVEGDLGPLENVRLLNPTEMETRFVVDRGEVAGLAHRRPRRRPVPLDDDGPEQVLIAARELDLASIPNRSWQGLHLINTRGCGLVLAPSGRVQESQRPDYERSTRPPGAVLQPDPVRLRDRRQRIVGAECDEPLVRRERRRAR